MSTSLLFHGFGVRGYQYRKMEFINGGIVIHITQKMETCQCAACGSKNVVRRGTVERCFRCLPIGGKSVAIVLPVQRVFCLECKVQRQVEIKFAEPRRSYTKSFARYVLELSRLMTIKDVAAPGSRLGPGQSDSKARPATTIFQAEVETGLPP